MAPLVSYECPEAPALKFRHAQQTHNPSLHLHVIGSDAVNYFLQLEIVFNCIVIVRHTRHLNTLLCLLHQVRVIVLRDMMTLLF